MQNILIYFVVVWPGIVIETHTTHLIDLKEIAKFGLIEQPMTEIKKQYENYAVLQGQYVYSVTQSPQ